MDIVEKEIIINRIGAGLTLCRLDRLYYLVSPTLEDKFLADTIYEREIKRGQKADLYDDDELLYFLLDNELWSDKEEESLNKLQIDIDNLKISLYESYFQVEKQKAIKIALRESREKLHELYTKRHVYDYMSIRGVAAIARSRFLALMSLRTMSKKRAISRKYWSQHIDMADSIIHKINESRIEDGVLREIARTEPWRSYWSCQKKIFKGSPLEWSDGQRSLSYWSCMYDWVYKHPQHPPESIINDDDTLDGWLIQQRRKIDTENEQSLGNNMIKNEKIRNAQEVYIMVDSKEGVEKVKKLNTPQAQRLKAQRLKLIREKGEVNELDMPDTDQRLRMEATQVIAARTKKIGS